MTTDPILIINLCFDALYSSVKEDTQHQEEVCLKELQLEGLTIENQVLKLCEKMSCRKKEMSTMAGREYAHDIASEAFISHLFLGRFLFNNINDECLIRKGLLAKRNVRLLDEVYKQMIAQLPPSTYEDFLISDTNALIHDLKEKSDIKTLTAYLSIKSWQTEKTIECVKLESSHFIERFIASSGESGENKVEITSEIKQINYLFKNAPLLSASQFIKECLKLKAFDPKWLPEDKIKFHRSFCHYVEGDFQDPSFNAPFLQSNLEKIQLNKIADAPLCCWSLINYRSRLEWSLENDTHPGQSKEPLFDSLFSSTFLPEYYHNNKELTAFKKKYSSKRLPADEYKKFLLVELEKYRLQYKKSTNPEYYHLLLAAPCLSGYHLKGDISGNDDFNKFYIATGLIRNYFVHNCLKGIDIGKHTEELKQMIKLHKMMVFLMKELTRIDGSYQDATMKEILLNCKNFELIAAMIPTENILDQLMNTGTACFTQIQAGLPVYIIAENLKESLKETFHLAENHLKKFLKTQTIDHKRMYITDLRKDLKYLLKDIKPEELLLRYHITELQYLLKIEMKDIKEHLNYPRYEPSHKVMESEATYEHSENSVINHDNGKVKKRDQLMAFMYENNRVDHLPLVFGALKKLKAISSELTMPQFRKLFNGQEVITPVKWLANPGELRVFIQEAINTKMLTFPYQQQWHIAVRCFVKEDGTAFNALSLKSAKPGSSSKKFAQAGSWLKG